MVTLYHNIDMGYKSIDLFWLMQLIKYQTIPNSRKDQYCHTALIVFHYIGPYI